MNRLSRRLVEDIELPATASPLAEIAGLNEVLELNRVAHVSTKSLDPPRTVANDDGGAGVALFYFANGLCQPKNPRRSLMMIEMQAGSEADSTGRILKPGQVGHSRHPCAEGDRSHRTR